MNSRSARTRLPDDNSELEPPDPIPNSAVKRFSADGSVGIPHVRVGHRQALFEKPSQALGFFFVVPPRDADDVATARRGSRVRRQNREPDSGCLHDRSPLTFARLGVLLQDLAIGSE